MKKYLGIDFGDAYIGLALASDESMAVPYKVVQTADFWKELEALVSQEKISAIVVGWPFSMSGQSNMRTEKTAQFITQLKGRCTVPVYRSDERLSSLAARRKTSRRRVDALAAADILQTYLDAHGASDAI